MLNTPPCPCRQIYVSNSNGVNSNASNTRFKSVAPVIVSNSNGVNSNAMVKDEKIKNLEVSNSNGVNSN